MNEETAFLSAIRQCPADETARLVYADWLDEQGDAAHAAKAGFIRVELPLADEDPDQLQQLASPLPSDWLALVCRAKIASCSLRLIRPCPMRWDALTPSGELLRRTCGTCQRSVQFCESGGDGLIRISRSEIVVFSPAVPLHILDRFVPWLHIPQSLISVGTELVERSRLPKRSPAWHEERAASQSLTRSDERDDSETQCAVPLPRTRRTGGRVRNRNIQREDWEETE